MLVREMMEQSCEKYAEYDAVKWLVKKEVFSRSYKDLHQSIISVRKALKEEGFTGKHISIIGYSSVCWMEAYLGIITGKSVAVPLDCNLPVDELAELINRSDSEGLFLGLSNQKQLDELIVRCPKLRKIWILTDEDIETENDKVVSFAQLKNEGETITEDVEAPDAEDVATIMFTSGTTGKSKGVMLSQNNIAANVENVIFNAEPGDCSLSVLPIHHAFCLVMDWLKGFEVGASVAINDSLMRIVRNMGIFQPKVMLMVPMMIETLYKKLKAADPLIPKKEIAKAVFGGKLEVIFTGGAHLEPFYIDEFAEYGIQVLEGYGMSECSPVISRNVEKENKPGSIGKPLKNVEIRFDNGEILVKGSSVMKGYYKMPEETAAVLQDGWLRTGDKGYMDEDGYLYINGRVKNLIILSNGENISPEELENKLALFPLIGEVVVTGEDTGLTARVYPDQDVIKAKGLENEAVHDMVQQFIDEYNNNQPGYRRITGLVIRKNPFIRNTTRKIRRQDVLIDEPITCS